ncbi:MAG TPA: hypothetical protein VKA68_09715, partial [bacterium]|nr:hypothetical protein [bacterium]
MNFLVPTWQRCSTAGLIILFAGLITSLNAQYTAPAHPLVAKYYCSGFEDAHDTYNAISSASDGRIYYVLSSAGIDEAGQMYVYDPDTDQVEFLADLNEICGEGGQKAVPQGKSHVNFY